MKKRLLVSLAIGTFFLGLAGTAMAVPVPFSIMIGDNDGYGESPPIPDNGPTPWPSVVYDNRSPAEIAATDGSELTDVYSSIGYGPNPTVGSVLFDTSLLDIQSAVLTVDMADFQTSTFGPIAVFYNGVYQPGLFDFDDGFQNSVVRSFSLDATTIASINSTGQFVLGLNRSGSGDYIAFDYFELSGRATVIPEPGTLMLFGVGMAGLAGVARRRRR